MKMPWFHRTSDRFDLRSVRCAAKGKKAVIVGCGKAGIDYHLKTYQKAGLEVVALCDSVLDVAERQARDNGIRDWYSTLDEALGKDHVDVVSICTPVETHYELCQKALKAGAHVLVEKPVTSTRQELRDLDSQLPDATSILTVVHNKKFWPGIMSAKEFFDTGQLGEILQIDISWITNLERDPFISHRNHWSHRLSGGRWAEVAPHLLYSAYQFCSEMKLLDVQVRSYDDRWPWLPGDDASVQLETSSGFVNLRFGHSHRDNLSKNYTDNLNIFGSKGMLIVYPFSCFLSETDPKSTKGSPTKKRVRDITQSKYIRDVPTAKTGHDLVVRDFLGSAFLGTPPATPWAEAKHVMELTLDIGEALEQKSGRERPE